MLAIHLLTFNSEPYLEKLFLSLEASAVPGMVIRILDNASSDGTVAWLEGYKERSSLQIELITSNENVGFAKGHNQLLHHGNEPYVMILNHDVFLEPDCLSDLLETMEHQADIAMISPRLMQWDTNRDDGKGTLVDSLGLRQYKNKRVVEIGAGEVYQPTPGIHDVFGVSATAAIIRRSVIDEVMFSDGTLFDEVYVAYKEDVDLAWRLQRLHKKIVVHHDAVAYHDRTAADGADKGDLAKARNKWEQNAYVRYHSYKNHLMTLYKNLDKRALLLDFLPIFWYEGKKFIWFLLFDRAVLSGLKEIRTNWQELKTKRHYIHSV